MIYCFVDKEIAQSTRNDNELRKNESVKENFLKPKVGKMFGYKSNKRY